MKVLVLHDAVAAGCRADEQDNIVQARAVADALRGQDLDAELMAFRPELDQVARALAAKRPDVVFNLVESCWGTGRLVHFAPSILDVLGLRYTGSGVYPLLATADKVRTKELLRQAGLPTPAWHTRRRLGRQHDPVKGPFLIKPVYEHGSVGLEDGSLVDVQNVRELSEALEKRVEATGLECFAEAYVEGREFNIAVLHAQGATRALPPAEMTFDGYAPGKPRILGYDAKWREDSFEYENTRRRFDFPPEDEGLLTKLRSLALACWLVFGLKGYARIDFRVDAKGAAWIIDVNPNPCIAPDAGLTAMAGRAGLSYPELVRRIVDAACEDPWNP